MYRLHPRSLSRSSSLVHASWERRFSKLDGKPSKVCLRKPLQPIHLTFTPPILDAKATPQGALQGDVAGVGNATSGSASDQLTRQHRMTLDEAHLILNVKQGEEMEQVMKVRPPFSPHIQVFNPSSFALRNTNTYSKPTPPSTHLQNPKSDQTGNPSFSHRFPTTSNQKSFEPGSG